MSEQGRSDQTAGEGPADPNTPATSSETAESAQQEQQGVPQEPAGNAVEGGTSHDPYPGGGVAPQDKVSAEDTPPEALPEEQARGEEPPAEEPQPPQQQ